MTGKKGNSPESIVREIKRQTRRKFTAEEKIRIVSRACGARPALPTSAGRKASIPRCTTSGARRSSRRRQETTQRRYHSGGGL